MIRPPAQAKEEIVVRLSEHQTVLHQFGVKGLSLFGSFVRNAASEDSDVDLLVEFEAGQKTFDNFMGLSFFLEDLLGRPVEVVTRESLSPYLASSILSEVEDVTFGA